MGCAASICGRDGGSIVVAPLDYSVAMTTIDRDLQAAAGEIVEDAAARIGRQATRHAKRLAVETGLDPVALRIGLLRLVGTGVKDRVWGEGRQARDDYLSAAEGNPARHAEAMRQLQQALLLQRTAIYGSFGDKAVMMRRSRRRRRESEAEMAAEARADQDDMPPMDHLTALDLVPEHLRAPAQKPKPGQD